MERYWAILGFLFVGASLAISPAANGMERQARNVAHTGAKTELAMKDTACAAGEPVNGVSPQAKHSAEATAHKTLNDPNNQLGTSLSGRTRSDNCVTSPQLAMIDGEAIE